MTREEAIKYLNTMLFALYVKDGHQIPLGDKNEVKTAIQMAIEALQRCQEIDNKFANATETDWVKEGFTDAEVKDICDEARKALQTEPLEVEAAKLQQAYNKGFDDCRQAVLETLDWYEHDKCEIESYIREIADDIKRLPSVNPHIIRCKDCKWFGKSGCAIEIVDDSDKPKEDDFCSFAEKKEEGDTE